MDQIINLLDGWGPGNPDTFDIESLSLERVSEVAFMFGGVGDGSCLP